MEREQGAQRGRMVTVESSEVRRTSQSDRQCVKEWSEEQKKKRNKSKKGEGDARAKGGRKTPTQ